jgi:hypothetical protein
MTKIQVSPNLERWTSWLLVFLALGAFVLSFAGMYAVAVDAGYGWLAWLWPLVTESAVVIFSLILLTAKLDGFHNHYLHLMIVGCTSLSVLFNIWHAPNSDLLTRAVVALPPIFLYAAFKTWIWKVEQDAKRAGLVMTLDNLRQDIDAVNAELQEHVQELDQLGQERDTLTGQIEALTVQLDTLRADMARTNAGTKPTSGAFVLGDLDSLATANDAKRTQAEDRKRQALAMWSEGMSRADIAAALEVTPRTVKRYLNGHGGHNE